MKPEQILKLSLDQNIIKEIPADSRDRLALATEIINRDLLKVRKADEDEDLSEDDKFYNSILNAKIEKGLPVPHEIEGTPPTLPMDFTELSDKDVRFQHGAFNACAARAGYLYALEEAGEAAAKQVADHYEDEYITGLGEDRKDFGGKPKTQALLKSEAQQANPDIVKWRKREKQHSIAANKYKRILETYNNNCDRLSREWSMRVQERDNSS